MKKPIVITVLVLAFLSVAFTYYILSPKTHVSENVALNTLITMKITGKNPKVTSSTIIESIQNFEKQNSMYLPQSYISKVNSTNEFVSVPKSTYDMVKRAYALCQESGGKFDITIAPLVLLWDISASNPKLPVVTKEVLSLIDYKEIEFNDETSSIKLNKEGQKIDLGGVAKGQVCDEIRKILAQDGTKSAIINVGGNVLLYGKDSFNVGIKHPRSENSVILSTNVQDKNVSTAGDYERYFEIDGKRYHHIFDKNKGLPYDSEFYSVSVITHDGMLGDYLSTYLFMSDKATVLDMMEKHDIIAVGKDNKIYASKNLDIEILDKSFSKFSKD